MSAVAPLHKGVLFNIFGLIYKGGPLVPGEHLHNVLDSGGSQWRSHIIKQLDRYIQFASPNQSYILFPMQSVQILNHHRKRSHKRYPEILNRTREQKFNNRYSLNEKAKAYEALSDPYTSYYFSNKAVKDHLKELKRALKHEPNATEKTRINKLITLRMKEKFQDFMCPKTSIYQQSLGDIDLKKIHEKSSKSIDTQRHSNAATQKESPQVAPVVVEKSKPVTNRKETQRLPRIKNDTISHSRKSEDNEAKPQPSTENDKKKTPHKQIEQRQIADRLAEQLHQKKHDKWLTFLEQKRKLLVTHTQTPAVQTKSEQPQKE